MHILKAKEFRKKGLKLKEVQELLVSDNINKRFVMRHYYEEAGQRITLDFVSFDEFVKIKKEEFFKYGHFLDKIEYITKKSYDDEVYDFNVADNHNFIANNVIVSNCGMRLVTTNLTFKEVQPKLKELVDSLFKTVPSGVGSRGFVDANKSQFKEMMSYGSKWCVENGYGWSEDLERTEGYGRIDWADPEKVSSKALERGMNQLGTLGSGNHYLEIQVARAENVYDAGLAKKIWNYTARTSCNNGPLRLKRFWSSDRN